MAMILKIWFLNPLHRIAYVLTVKLLLGECPEHHQWEINIGTGNDWLLSGNQPISKPIMIYEDKMPWHQIHWKDHSCAKYCKASLGTLRVYPIRYAHGSVSINALLWLYSHLVVDFFDTLTLWGQSWLCEKFSALYLAHHWLCGKLWDLQHNCVGDTIVYH